MSSPAGIGIGPYRDVKACSRGGRVEDGVIHFILISEELLEVGVIHQGASHCQLYMWLVNLHIQSAVTGLSLFEQLPRSIQHDTTYRKRHTLQERITHQVDQGLCEVGDAVLLAAHDLHVSGRHVLISISGARCIAVGLVILRDAQTSLVLCTSPA